MKETHEPMLVTWRLETPAIAGDGISLAGIIAAQVYEMTGDPDASLPISVDETTGLLMASDLFFCGIHSSRPASIVRSVRAGLYIDDRMLRPTRGDDLLMWQTKNQGPDDFKVDTEAVDTICATSVAAIVHGDREEIEAALDDVAGIGRRRGQGHGAVSGLRVERAEWHDRFGILDGHRRPARIIPEAAWRMIGVNTHVDMDWRRAGLIRWSGPREPCAIPVSILSDQAPEETLGVTIIRAAKYQTLEDVYA